MEPKITREQVENVMDNIGFGNSKKYPQQSDRAADCEMGVSTYSGGWKMKMQLCAATLMNADILMLDEPTGHLDVKYAFESKPRFFSSLFLVRDSGVSIPKSLMRCLTRMVLKPKSISTSMVSPSIILITLTLYSYIITFSN